MPSSDPIVLFTAFEPSGDALAAGMIRELREQRPDLKIWAMGGPKMEAAGAELIERTTDHAVMLFKAVGQVQVHLGRLSRLKKWLADKNLLALVPVDSPAANWSICALVRKHHPRAKVVHLPSPQIWAWASWRQNRLRRLTHKVLCILPFEPKWLGDRNIPAVFVGHPLFTAHDLQQDYARVHNANFDDGKKVASGATTYRLGLLPGSRGGEWEKNWPMMLDVYLSLRKEMPKLEARVAALNDRAAKKLSEMADEAFAKAGIARPAGFEILIDKLGEVLSWSDVVLAVSGTVTLEVAMHDRPMVAIYNVNRYVWSLFGRFIVSTRTFTLPNLISESQGDGRVIREFVPHFGHPDPVLAEVGRLLRDPEARTRQQEGLRRVCEPFKRKDFAKLAVTEFFEGGGVKPAVQPDNNLFGRTPGIEPPIRVN